MICDDVDRDLDRYIDRELDSAATAAVREHLETCAACGARVAEREALGRLIRATPFHTAPAHLRVNVSTRARRSSSTRHLLAWAAATVLVVALGGVLTLVLRSRDRLELRIADAAAEEVVSGHVRSLMGNHLFDVQSTDQHTVKPWFLGKLDFSPPVSDLASTGFPLVGGRLDYVGARPVAALVYQRHKHIINVFVSPGADVGKDSIRSIRGFHVHHWSHGGMSFWAVSDLNDAELATFVRALQDFQP